MVAKLLCLSIWMSVSMLAMQECNQEYSRITTKSKLPKLYTGLDNLTEKVRSDAHRDGLMVGRKESEEQIKALQSQQELLLKCMESTTQMNQKLLAELQQLRAHHETVQTDILELASQCDALITLNKSFRERPADQLAKLQEIVQKFRTLGSS